MIRRSIGISAFYKVIAVWCDHLIILDPQIWRNCRENISFLNEVQVVQDRILYITQTATMKRLISLPMI
jgi:hypothetical protein